MLKSLQIFGALILAVFAGLFYIVSLFIIVLIQPLKMAYKSLAQANS